MVVTVAAAAAAAIAAEATVTKSAFKKHLPAISAFVHWGICFSF
jgi:hypothetical protein